MKEDKVLRLSSGFTFEYANLFGENKVTEADVTDLAARIEGAAEAVGTIRKTGVAKGHLSKDGLPELVLFPQLPYIVEENLNSPSSLAKLKDFGQRLKYNVDAVISFGIGGSYLGNKVLFDMHCGEFWNGKSLEDRNGYPKLYFSGNNIDPRRTSELIENIVAEAAVKAKHGKGNYKVVLVVISKSGSTVDTMSTFMVAYDALKANEAIDIEIVAVTDPAAGEKATVLGKVAAQQGWQTFAVPDGVGGRFSVFSEVGLITAACIGFDIDDFLAGARFMDEACQNRDVWNNPALLNAVLKYAAAENYGRDIEVFMPYGDYLKSVAEWYIQLLAESLGKRSDRDGNTVYYGRTPIVAVGTTDMHAQTQQHQDGKLDKVVQFLRVGKWAEDPIIPDCFSGTKELSDLAGIPLSRALDAALDSNAEALANDNRFNAVITLPKMSAYHLGELLYMLALSIAYEGELANVNAFDQPGVEAYKKIMKVKLKNSEE